MDRTVLLDALEQKAATEDGRRTLESNQRQLCELERLGQDVRYQARIASQDLQRPIERILDCCRRLEEQSGSGLDGDAQALLADAHKAAAEARRLVSQLQAVVAARAP